MRLVNKLLQASLRKTSPKFKNDVVLKQMIDHYSRFSPSPLSLRQFLDFGKFVIISFANMTISIKFGL